MVKRHKKNTRKNRTHGVCIMGTPIKFRTPDLCMYFQGVMKARS